MITFNHSGGIGDIFYSLYFCKDIIDVAKQSKFNFHIQTNVQDKDMSYQTHPFGITRMPVSGANFIKPLLCYQTYINDVTISDECLEKSINLDHFRKLKLNLGSGDIRQWYYNLATDHLKREFWKPIIDAPKDFKYKDKIILICTERYQNLLTNYSVLKDFKDNFVFMGTDKEYQLFNEKYFEVERAPINDALDAAEKMMGAIGVVGNQSGLYSIAECLKVKRIMCAAEIIKFGNGCMLGPHNVHPQGGWCEDVSITEKLYHSVKEMLK